MSALPRIGMGVAALAMLAVATGGAPASAPEPEAVRQATERGLKLVQTAAANYPSHRQCFSCHHQTLPILAMVAARGQGLAIDGKILDGQVEFSLESFREHLDSMKEGKGVGGRALTVGYGLWAFDLAGHKPDDVTDAMVSFLLKTQEADGRWAPQTKRPPLEESPITCTAIAALGLKRYAGDADREAVDAALEHAKAWLADAPRKSQEDRVAWLWGLHTLGSAQSKIDAARAEVLAAQKEDGGWAQLDDMASDAYATGQTLRILNATGTSPTDPAFVRGVQFLLKTQLEDGSWLVETRSRPIQTFFDNGDPHGKNQFISTSATSWAVAALAAAGEPKTQP